MKLFAKKTDPVFGLDIGSTSVRLLQLSSHGSGYQIDHFAIEPLAEGTVVDKTVPNVEAVSAAISQAVRTSGTNAKSCVIAVSGAAVFTKTISLPAQLAEADIESHVQIEARRHVPYPLDELSLDFEVLGPSSRNADSIDILLAASKREIVESRQDAVEIAGLKACVVDVEAFAIANAFELIRKRDAVSRSEAVGFFNIDHDLSTLLVIKDARVIYTRDHSSTAHELPEETRHQYGVNIEQNGFYQHTEAVLAAVEEPVLQSFQLNIVDQISRAIQFYLASSDYSTIGALYLSGGFASLKDLPLNELAAMVQQKLEVRTRVANPVSGMDMAGNVVLAEVKSNAARLMIAMGLALRGLD